jgi:hypothetical protein
VQRDFDGRSASRVPAGNWREWNEGGTMMTGIGQAARVALTVSRSEQLRSPRAGGATRRSPPPRSSRLRGPGTFSDGRADLEGRRLRRSSARPRREMPAKKTTTSTCAQSHPRFVAKRFTFRCVSFVRGTRSFGHHGEGTDRRDHERDDVQYCFVDSWHQDRPHGSDLSLLWPLSLI